MHQFFYKSYTSQIMVNTIHKFDYRGIINEKKPQKYISSEV